mmetsp:Transcript_72923/g.194614  ORF Transcript_72923/g.194614 Transcript_72923/m.194614 type:complete len:321 (+) Transcript_72923:82-1044(+)
MWGALLPPTAKALGGSPQHRGMGAARTARKGGRLVLLLVGGRLRLVLLGSFLFQSQSLDAQCLNSLGGAGAAVQHVQQEMHVPLLDPLLNERLAGLDTALPQLHPGQHRRFVSLVAVNNVELIADDDKHNAVAGEEPARDCLARGGPPITCPIRNPVQDKQHSSHASQPRVPRQDLLQVPLILLLHIFKMLADVFLQLLLHNANVLLVPEYRTLSVQLEGGCDGLAAHPFQLLWVDALVLGIPSQSFLLVRLQRGVLSKQCRVLGQSLGVALGLRGGVLERHEVGAHELLERGGMDALPEELLGVQELAESPLHILVQHV